MFRDYPGGTPMIRRKLLIATGTIASVVIAACDGQSSASPTAPSAPVTITASRGDAVSRNVSGHISGQIIGPNKACNGAVTEVGTFTGQPGGTFVACVTNMLQRGDGALVFDLVHTYTTENGDTFTTSDHVVAGPINPPIYRINNSATITGGTGLYEGASGFIHDEGTLNFAIGVVSVDYHGRITTP
jgi:hypothetical protein